MLCTAKRPWLPWEVTALRVSTPPKRDLQLCRIRPCLESLPVTITITSGSCCPPSLFQQLSVSGKGRIEYKLSQEKPLLYSQQTGFSKTCLFYLFTSPLLSQTFFLFPSSPFKEGATFALPASRGCAKKYSTCSTNLHLSCLSSTVVATALDYHGILFTFAIINSNHDSLRGFEFR